MVPVRPGEYPFHEDQFWAEPDQADAVRLMHLVIDDPTERERRVVNASAFMRTPVPSRFMLELTGASSGDMRLSDHAARSMI
jgi:hypothetical protein